MIRIPFAPRPWSDAEEQALRNRIEAECFEIHNAAMSHACDRPDCEACQHAKAATSMQLKAQRDYVVSAARAARTEEIARHTRYLLVTAVVTVTAVASASLTVLGVAVLLRGVFRAGWW